MNVATEKQVQIIRPLAEYSDNARIQRVAAYCRVSTDSDDQVNSFLNQVRYYTDFIRTSDKMELVDIYADEGITGTSLNKREDFKRMLNDARLGKIDRIYVKSVQRFARNSLECLETVRKLADYGASVYFENDRIDTRTMSSEMILYIKSAFAQNDSLNFSKRMAMSYRMKMEEGNFITYCAPYGYRLENGSLVIVEEEAIIVVRIFDMYLAGKGMGQIAAILNREGVYSREGKWNTTHIRYILSNEKYIGDALLQKTYTPEILPLRNRKNNGEKDKFYVTNSHPAIISREVFEAAQQRLKEREQYAPKKPKQQYLLSRMIYCNECGWAYKRKVQHGVIYWVCSQKGVAGYECGGKNLLESEIFSSFIIMYNRLRQYETLLVDNTLTQLIDIRTRLVSGSQEIAEIDAEIAKLCSQNDMYSKLRAKNIMDEVSYAEQTAELQNRIATLRCRRLKLISEDEDTHYIEDLRFLKELLQSYPPAILSFDENLFTSIVERIKADDNGNITFVLKGGLNLKESVGVVA